MSIHLTLPLVALTIMAAGCGPTHGDARPAHEPGSLSLLDAPDRFLRHEDVTMRYRIIGEGDPVLLLHGYTDRIEMWAGTADSLARDFRVIVPDLRGFGQSTKSGDPAKYGRTLVDDMIGLADSLRVQTMHVVGYSMGGVIAANMALSIPERVRSVTFVAGAFYPDSTAARKAFGVYIDSLAAGHGIGPFFRWILPTWSDSAVNTILPELTAINDSASLVASLQALPSMMPDPKRVARAATPALAIVSVKDRMLSSSRYIARQWPGLRLVELPTFDHSDIFLAPELVIELRALSRRASK